MQKTIEWIFILAVGAFFLGSLWFVIAAFETEVSNPLFTERYVCLAVAIASALTLILLLIKKFILDRR